MTSTKQQAKEDEIKELTKLIEKVNNQISKLEETSMNLSNRIILAHKQLLLIKGTN